MLSGEIRSVGKLEITFGVRSACRNTVTFALSTHVGVSCGGDCAAGGGLSSEDDTLMHKAAKMSAALSVALLVCRSSNESIITVVSLIAFDKTPSVHIDDQTSATIVATKHVKAADTLSKALRYFIGPRFFFIC